jgi:prefoldin subunit 5
MRRFFTTLLFTLFILYPAICMPAEYLITLHSGGKLIVDGYWEEGNRLIFNIFGGSVVVEKDWVESITKVEKKKAAPEKKLTPHQQEKIEIRDRLQALYKQLNKDKKRGKPSRIEKRMRQIEEAQNKLYDLSERVRRKNNGELPEWWEEIKVPYLKEK